MGKASRLRAARSAAAVCAICQVSTRLVKTHLFPQYVHAIPDSGWRVTSLRGTLPATNWPSARLICAVCADANARADGALRAVSRGTPQDDNSFGFRLVQHKIDGWRIEGDGRIVLQRALVGIVVRATMLGLVEPEAMEALDLSDLGRRLRDNDFSGIGGPYGAKWFSFDTAGLPDPRGYRSVRVAIVDDRSAVAEVSFDGMKWFVPLNPETAFEGMPEWGVQVIDATHNASWFGEYAENGDYFARDWSEYDKDSRCPCGLDEPARDCCGSTWLKQFPNDTAPTPANAPSLAATANELEELPEIGVARRRSQGHGDKPGGLGSDIEIAGGVVATCRLCVNEKQLRLSHVFPKWALREMKLEGRDGGTPGIIHAPEDEPWANAMQDGYKHYLLCAECEQYLGEAEKVVKDITHGNHSVMARHGVALQPDIQGEWRLVGEKRHLVTRALLGIALKYHYAPSARFRFDSEDTAREVRTMLAHDDYSQLSHGPTATRWYNLERDSTMNPRACANIAFGTHDSNVSIMIGGTTWMTPLRPFAHDDVPWGSGWVIAYGDIRACAFYFEDWEQWLDSFDFQAAWAGLDDAEPCPCRSGSALSECCAVGWMRGMP